MNCPNCNSSKIIKNGTLSSGNQSYRCKSCDKQFVENPLKSAVKKETIELIDKLLLERLSLAGIVRVTGVSESWLQTYVNDKYEKIPQEVDPAVLRVLGGNRKKNLKSSLMRRGHLLGIRK